MMCSFRSALINAGVSYCNQDRSQIGRPPLFSSPLRSPQLVSCSNSHPRSYSSATSSLSISPYISQTDIGFSVISITSIPYLDFAVGGARRARMLCIPALCGRIPDDQIPESIPEVLGECILAVKEVGHDGHVRLR